MPGVIGIASEKLKKADKKLLAEMCTAIRHEKWYKIDKHINSNFALARVHLAILNPQSQPIFNENKSICVFMDGEIFGYEKEKQNLEIRGHKFKTNNDPEFCLHLYEEFGEKSFEKLNGSFVLVIADVKKHKIIITNDRYGLRPLYYTKNDDGLIFSSEIKAILKDPSFKKVIDEDAVAEFFTFGQLLGNKTFFRDIELLPSASFLEWHKGKTKIKSYWKYEFPKAVKLGDGEYADESLKIFRQVIGRMSGDRKNLAVALTGGLDSRFVIGSLKGEKSDDIKTFTFVFDGIDATPRIAKQVAKTCNVENTHVQLTPEIFLKYLKRGIFLTEGMNPVYDHIIMLPIMEKLEGKILVNGFLMDAVFGGGYIKNSYFSIRDVESFKKMMYKEFSLPREQLSGLLRKEMTGVAYKSFEREAKKYIRDPNSFPSSALYFKIQNRGRRRMGGNLIVTVWKAEYRNPSYDYDFMDFVLAIPKKRLMDRKIQIEALKKLNPELAKIKNNHTGVNADAPDAIRFLAAKFNNIYSKIRKMVETRTHGKISLPGGNDYPDYGKWIRKNKKLRDFITEILLDEKTLNRKYYNKDFIRKMVYDHISYKKDYTQLICILLTFELWYRMFIEGEHIDD